VVKVILRKAASPSPPCGIHFTLGRKTMPNVLRQRLVITSRHMCLLKGSFNLTVFVYCSTFVHKLRAGLGHQYVALSITSTHFNQHFTVYNNNTCKHQQSKAMNIIHKHMPNITQTTFLSVHTVVAEPRGQLTPNVRGGDQGNISDPNNLLRSTFW